MAAGSPRVHWADVVNDFVIEASSHVVHPNLINFPQRRSTAAKATRTITNASSSPSHQGTGNTTIRHFYSLIEDMQLSLKAHSAHKPHRMAQFII